MKQTTQFSVTIPGKRNKQQSGGWLKLCFSVLFCLTAFISLASAQSWTAMPTLPGNRLDFGVATGPDGKIYVIGGIQGVSALATVDVFDPLTSVWSPGPPMPGGKRARMGVVTGIDGKIYAIGGQIGSQPTDRVERFDPKSGQWETLNSLNKARFLTAAAVGPDGRIYAIGGETSGGVLNEVEVFDGANWTVLSATMNYARLGHTAVTGLDGFIYVFGGHGGATVERFNGSQWEVLTAFNSYRSGFASVTGPDGHLYTLGGSFPVFTGSAVVEDLFYAPDDPLVPVNWFDPNPPSMLTARGHLAAAAAEGNIFAIGGYSKALGELNVVEAYGTLAAPDFGKGVQSNRVAIFRFEDFLGIGLPDEYGTLFGGTTKDDSINQFIGDVKGYAAYTGRVNSTISTPYDFTSLYLNSYPEGVWENRGDYLRVADHPALNFGTGSFTIEGWIQLNRNTGLDTLLDKRKLVTGGNTGGDGNTLPFVRTGKTPVPVAQKYRGYHLFFNPGGKLGLQLANGVTYANYLSTQSVPLATQTTVLGGWTHIAVSVDRATSNPRVRFYINGVLSGEFPALTGDLGDFWNTQTGVLNIGRHNFNSSVFYGGLDDLAIYNRALNWPEIRAVFLAGQVGKQ